MCAAAVADHSRLVHSDFNPKNLVVAQDGAGWRVSAVLDWEFAFAGPPLTDVGNMLRFGDDLPDGFEDAFIESFAAGGGELPPDWRRIAEALDLVALLDLAARERDNPIVSRARAKLRRLAATA